MDRTSLQGREVQGKEAAGHEFEVAGIGTICRWGWAVGVIRMQKIVSWNSGEL